MQWELWHRRLQMYAEETSTIIHHEAIDQQRSAILPEMRCFLLTFLQGAMTVHQFNVLFQQQARTAWSAFCLSGLSGGMFLHKLVKYIVDQDRLEGRLRSALRLPEDTRDGQRRMQSFSRFLETLIASGHVSRGQLQPARVPFFLSAWWHLQAPEKWPVFYPQVAQAIRNDTEQASAPISPVEAYFAFRLCFQTLSRELQLSSWKLEHLLVWWGQGKESNERQSHSCSVLRTRAHPTRVATHMAVSVVSPPPVVHRVNQPAPLQKELDEQEASRHTHVQWLLAKIGRKVGCEVWIASNDHGKVWKKERLGNLILQSLSILADSAFQRIVSRIDVLWFLHDEIIAAYEIERTTDISTGLLRLYDLGALFPKRDISLCVVTPHDRFGKVQFELSRPTFDGCQMRKYSAIINEEVLLQHEEHILRWATSPSILHDLIDESDDHTPQS